MEERSTSDGHHCSRDGDHCMHCGGDEATGADGGDPSQPRGARLAWSAAGLFLYPLVLAIVGAVLAARAGYGELIGALAGLLLGMATAALAARWIGPQRGSSA